MDLEIASRHKSGRQSVKNQENLNMKKQQSWLDEEETCKRCGGSGTDHYYEYSSGEAVLASERCSCCQGSGRCAVRVNCPFLAGE
jgi:DnaJ-class molecular chaperone